MNINKIIGGILLVSCTTIGGGVLALPLHTIQGGFFFTTATFVICWLFMTIGALLMLEVTLWAGKETNLISMAGNTLGGFGKVSSWCTYLMLLYSLISVYLIGSSAWILQLINQSQNTSIPSSAGVTIIAIIIGIIIFLGTAIADHFNRFLSLGLILAYSVLVVIGLPHVELSTIGFGDINSIPATIPLIITTFGFSIVVPSLANYLQQHKKDLLIVVLVGSIIPLLVYCLWEFITLGILSIEGPNGLMALANQNANSTEVANALENIVGNKWITLSAKIFSIFALLTSLVGVSLSLFHFLSDGLQVSQKGRSGGLLFLLTFLPPSIIALFFPEGFIKILSFGGIFVAFLLGILPVMMVWSGRYKHNVIAKFRVLGGKPVLIISGLFFVYVICQELISLL
jgi:tyrosine-specific transport protein